MSSTRIQADLARQIAGTICERSELEDNHPLSTVDDLLDACDVASFALGKVKELVGENINRGIAGRLLVFVLKESLDAVEVGIQAFEATKKRAEELAPENWDQVKRTLEEDIQIATKMQTEFSSLLEWLERPAPAVDLSSLPGKREDPAAEGYIDEDEFTARLLSSQDV